MTTQWNAKLYDSNHSFVSKYGQDLIELLNPQPQEHILDLGCGTGDLAHTLQELGATVQGVDNSATMIELAKEKYPTISFDVMDAYQLDVDHTFDAVFSNAVLHWLKEPERVIQQIHTVLKSGGRLVAEFGGAGNVQQITDALIHQMKEAGLSFTDEQFPWYFPSIGEYATLLEKAGFEVGFAAHFSRPTQLDGEAGLRNWLEMFSSQLFTAEQQKIKEAIFDKTIHQLASILYKDDTWFADYKRLRIVAIKK